MKKNGLLVLLHYLFEGSELELTVVQLRALNWFPYMWQANAPQIKDGSNDISPQRTYSSHQESGESDPAAPWTTDKSWYQDRELSKADGETSLGIETRKLG